MREEGQKPECDDTFRLLCAEVDDWQSVFSYYVGHDEPSNIFYSNTPGSGNRMRYQLTLPTDPAPTPIPGRSYNFMLHPAFWFGLAMCDTQSYPEQVSTCAADSDSNITSLQTHPGTAFMELQFYPPGYVKQFTGFSCDAVNYCAALTIDSLSEDPVAGTLLNNTCQSQILGGLEYVNFAYITKSGVPQGPPGPKSFQFVGSGDPGPNVLYMRPGDHITITLHDTAHGLQIDLNDSDTGQSGSMTASASNGFSQIQYAPTGSSCTETPYDFHPEYSTTSPQTRVPWAAHTYNVAFSDEIGHFDFCQAGLAVNKGTCHGLEGMPGDVERADGDDNGCFKASASTLVPVQGCLDTNAGFDGVSYQNVWPDGNLTMHPTPLQFTSPLTGANYDVNYDSSVFEADMPRIEAPDFGGSCNRTTGAGCTNPPITDDGAPATFYPFYSTTAGPCRWIFGNDFQNALGTNPCPS
ncbi:MAG: hypothetical protein E6G21_06980 [Actinobacteria bacterium]|nr:MAG: hypothetical protein E6G21_06980 [Actinomycetota bacterium]